MTAGPRVGRARRVGAAVLVAGLLVALAACGSPAQQGGQPSGQPSGQQAGTARTPVTIAAASDLKFALDELAVVVARDHPELELRVTYGSSGQFVQQIRNGAPFDLYLSADRRYVEDLAAEGLADPADVFDYAVGRLVTWYPAGAPGTGDAAGLAGLADPAIRTVSIANPQHAPYGQAAVAALASAGLEAAVTPKLVLGENVAQAAEFARTGNADAAVIALSLVLSDPLRDVGEWTEVPLDLYPTLRQAGTVLARAEHPDAARVVRDVVTGPEGRAVLREYGFILPGEDAS